ncbi:hypothetical protein [Persicitalea sp.]|uniref:hypothetical protein n=1 Tax=Persicitalea sp. TaxID=3100273 RepID=UPI00359342A7
MRDSIAINSQVKCAAKLDHPSHSLFKWDGLLTVSASKLSFVQTTADKPSFLVLTVEQQGVNEPVTLTTDAPECFQLAIDSRPVFSPKLALTPASRGTHVHVRYFSNKGDVHTGQLIIQNGLKIKNVVLEERHTRFLPAIQPHWPAIRKSAGTVRPQQAPLSKPLVFLLLALLVLLGIVLPMRLLRIVLSPFLFYIAIPTN